MMKKTDDKELKKEEETQNDEWQSKYLRALADYQNLEKRVAATRFEDRSIAAEKILRDLLPVADILEKAQTHVNDIGLGLAIKEFWKVLQEQGVVKIDVVRRTYDPYEMECIEVVPGENDIVVEEILPGYKLYDKILRVAKVKVGKNDIEKKK